MAFDIFKTITDKIIAQMELGIIPWTKPWVCAGGCISHVTGRPYSILNQILLGAPGEYLTYDQALAEGGHVKKGEKGHMIVFWKPLDKKDDQGNPVIDPDTGEVEKVFYLRYYTVFHLDQCEGIKPKWTSNHLPGEELLPDEKAEQLICEYLRRSGVHFKPEKSDRAFYSPASDMVVVPALSQFSRVSEYYSTVFHELTHSTGHAKRLNRITDVAAFGSEKYSKEELVAELGSCFVCQSLGLSTDSSFRNSVAYLQNWLQVLKNDKKLIVSAAGKAEAAVRYITNGSMEVEL